MTVQYTQFDSLITDEDGVRFVLFATNGLNFKLQTSIVENILRHNVLCGSFILQYNGSVLYYHPYRILLLCDTSHVTMNNSQSD